MKKQTIKKALPIVLGALVVSTVVSVIPFNNFAEAGREYFVSKDTIIEKKISTNKVDKKYITVEEAQSIALKRVGDKTAKITEVETDLDDSKPHYEIEVTTTHKDNHKDITKVFEIEIDAVTGDIKDVDVEVRKMVNGKLVVTKDRDDEDNKKDKDVVKENYIAEEKAIEIAIAKIGKTATLEEIELDDDDDTPVYEIEMYDDKYEYEIEIHAITGEMLEFERDED